jgi:hypothetical protein
LLALNVERIKMQKKYSELVSERKPIILNNG